MDAVEIKPQLPVAYELTLLDQVDCLRDTVIEMASRGAEEGTIVLAASQRNARGNGNKVWQALSGNMHAALVLQPEVAAERYHELLYVALVSLGTSIAAYVAPMTSLQYSWPNDICIARNKIAAVWLDQGECDGQQWVTVTCSVNLAEAPGDEFSPAMSIYEAEGNTDLGPTELFETWAREFVSWINHWDERGFGYILDCWRQRADLDQQPVQIDLAAGSLAGVADGVNQLGELIVKRPDGSQSSVSPRLFLGWE